MQGERKRAFVSAGRTFVAGRFLEGKFTQIAGNTQQKRPMQWETLTPQAGRDPAKCSKAMQAKRASLQSKKLSTCRRLLGVTHQRISRQTPGLGLDRAGWLDTNTSLGSRLAGAPAADGVGCDVHSVGRRLSPKARCQPEDLQEMGREEGLCMHKGSFVAAAAAVAFTGSATLPGHAAVRSGL